MDAEIKNALKKWVLRVVESGERATPEETTELPKIAGILLIDDLLIADQARKSVRHG